MKSAEHLNNRVDERVGEMHIVEAFPKCQRVTIDCEDDDRCRPPMEGHRFEYGGRRDRVNRQPSGESCRDHVATDRTLPHARDAFRPTAARLGYRGHDIGRTRDRVDRDKRPVLREIRSDLSELLLAHRDHHSPPHPTSVPASLARPPCDPPIQYHRSMSDLDLLRAAIADRNLVGIASGHLTQTIAMQLPFEALGPFKTALKQFFSRQPWTAADAEALSDLVIEHVAEGSWVHSLDDQFTLVHGISDGRYEITIGGVAEATPSIFDRAFAGPVIPVQTPHPRKVKFVVGGEPAPGRWYRRDDDTDDDRVTAMFRDDDITDVMVAGDFVTVGLSRNASWEARLDSIIDQVEELFWDPSLANVGAEPLTREELLEEGRSIHIGNVSASDLHLMDPDRPDHRETLIQALGSDDPRLRRAAVATMAMSTDDAIVKAAVVTGYNDESRLVRRTAVDSAADLESEEFRPLFDDAAVHDEDSWIRWKSVRALADLGASESEEALILAAADEDFRVRFEAAAALRTP